MMDNATPLTRDVIDLSGNRADEPGAAETKSAATGTETEIAQDEIERITTDTVTALKTVYDPEIPVDIYELGLIYKVDIDDDRKVDIDMTLTAPGCPVAGDMPGWVENAARTVEGVEDVEVRLTFDPPWDPSRMSDEARLALNML